MWYPRGVTSPSWLCQTALTVIKEKKKGEPGGVAAARACPEGPIQRCHAGDLQEPGVTG